MRDITTFRQANRALGQFISAPGGSRRYTLDRMRRLMDYLGNPQNNLKIIHIAGTSGKTSTAYYATALLREAGYNVGLTASPHVDEINERVQINMRPLAERQFCRELSRFLDLVDASGLNPTYFELLIAFSFWMFERQKVDYAVVEVGIGGLLDCTNVIDTADKVCVITDIGLDHTDVLGDTIEEIALQKAGIIQLDNAVFVSRQPGVVMNAITKQCRDVGAKLFVAGMADLALDLPLFQKRNFSLALEAANYLLMRDANQQVDDIVVKNAAQVHIPARMEVVKFKHKTIILDGSHNEQKINALVEATADKFPQTRIALLVCFGRNKQSSVAISMKKLNQLSTKIILTSFGDNQTGIGPPMSPDEMATLAKKTGFKTIISEPNPERAFDLLMKDEASIGLITGSFYSLNNFRPIIARDK